jgi:hypothetical protein
MQQIYTHLDKNRTEIRLLRIHLVEDDSQPIHCNLLPPQLINDVKGNYSALSYCSGDLKNTDTVFVDLVPCNVFANLAHALRESRHFWKEANPQDETFTLWVDQICIDQFNLEERSHEVGLLKSIYESGKMTLVRL